ncbi:hypothetical protein [Paenibacillus sp. JJ-100]|uniref:hypothetical protein n=1 Tax=Paenibacillus sp. JJ-100 TaxID=2974896 RepID=UPI00232DF1A3|nr:hypothetical protein [Paenibacillus sp. JJ-100]
MNSIFMLLVMLVPLYPFLNMVSVSFNNDLELIQHHQRDAYHVELSDLAKYVVTGPTIGGVKE